MCIYGSLAFLGLLTVGSCLDFLGGPKGLVGLISNSYVPIPSYEVLAKIMGIY
jgi:hypothetical protein